VRIRGTGRVNMYTVLHTLRVAQARSIDVVLLDDLEL
jgi:hypothetical protein